MTNVELHSNTNMSFFYIKYEHNKVLEDVHAHVLYKLANLRIYMSLLQVINVTSSYVPIVSNVVADNLTEVYASRYLPSQKLLINSLLFQLRKYVHRLRFFIQYIKRVYLFFSEEHAL